MNNQPFVPASFSKTSFNCPHCKAYARQYWQRLNDVTHISQAANPYDSFYRTLYAVRCEHCGKFELWHGEHMVIPDQANAPFPHQEMPSEVVGDYDEARNVLGSSPRSAAALLRLCIQKLCAVLGESGKNINEDIAALVRKGLPEAVQQALDIVRVVGNESVHPGELDVRDDPEIAAQLFELVNLIVEDRIARPKQIQALYMRLPQSKRDAIEKRDLSSAS